MKKIIILLTILCLVLPGQALADDWTIRTFDAVMDSLPDNATGAISPENVRDAIISAISLAQDSSKTAISDSLALAVLRAAVRDSVCAVLSDTTAALRTEWLSNVSDSLFLALLKTDIKDTLDIYITSFAYSILDDIDEATFKATVNLEIGTDVQAQDDDLATLAGMTAWRIPYSNGSSVVTELTLGANGTFLESNGASAAPGFRVLADGDIPTTLSLIHI